MKITKFENKIIKFIENHLSLFFIIIITIISLYARYKMLNFQSGDAKSYLLVWYNHIKLNGGLMALKNVIGNYTPAYLTILSFLTYVPIKPLISIKLVSILFDYLIAIFSALFIYKYNKNQKKNINYAIITYTIIVLSPLIILNGSLWAQCDAIYSFFLLISLFSLINKKYLMSFIMLGISCAFKLQFIFILPVYIILYFKEKEYSIFNFLFIPIMIIVCSLPAIIVGHPLIECFKVYLTQTNYYNSMTMNMFNFWLLFPNAFEYLSVIAYVIVLGFFGILLYILLKNKYKFNSNSKITLALLSILVCVYFLPNMHERYLFAGDVLSIIWCICHKDKYWVPITVNLISFTSYMPFLFKASSTDFRIVPIVYFLLIIYLIRYLLKEVGGNNG